MADHGSNLAAALTTSASSTSHQLPSAWRSAAPCRPSTVSQIVSKIVSERGGAVLMTAGGRAMHIGMAAVVMARPLLRARGMDVMLVPRFVTVDTTHSHGWESVFLRFTVYRWPAAPAAGPVATSSGPLGPPSCPGQLAPLSTQPGMLPVVQHSMVQPPSQLSQLSQPLHHPAPACRLCH